jgi:hypothetical protein
LEPYIFSILGTEGRWDATPLVRQICKGDVTLLVLGYPLEQSDGRQFDGYTFWPAPVTEALRATMVLDRQQAGRYLYVPRSPAESPGEGTCQA